jgi:hypothetical protein
MSSLSCGIKSAHENYQTSPGFSKLTSAFCHSLRSRFGSSDCCHRFAHSVGWSTRQNIYKIRRRLRSALLVPTQLAIIVHLISRQQHHEYLNVTSYLWPYSSTPLDSKSSSLFDHCPFLSPPATELCHRLRQSLFVRPGRLSAILHLRTS